VLLITQVVMTVVAFVLPGSCLGQRTAVARGCPAAAQGITMAFDGPTRMSLASELVPPKPADERGQPQSSAQFNTARLIGPAIGGLLIAGWGVGTGLLVNAISFVTVIAALLLMRPTP
jgi:MFS family permease